ncbi:MAG: trehalose-phosphatase, partial [Chrysiogenales bacterium]
AEHGALIKSRDEEWKSVLTIGNQWKDQIRPHLELYADRTPGSFIEEKEYSLVWHYRKSDAEFASIRAIELKSNLMEMIANLNLGIMEGNKVLEVKNLESSKGKIASYLIAENNFDFIMAIGDDLTDEDMFAAIPESGFSIKVGLVPSIASFHLAGPEDVRRLVSQMAHANET